MNRTSYKYYLSRTKNDLSLHYAYSLSVKLYLMNFQLENTLLTKLKQTILLKEEDNKFNQVRTP